MESILLQQPGGPIPHNMAQGFDHCLIKPSPGGPIPQNMAKTFDGPPTLERSGFEHQRAVTSPLPEEEGLGEKVEPSLRVKRDGVIFEETISFLEKSLTTRK